MSLQVHDFNVQVKIGKWKMDVIFKQLHIRVLSIYGTLTFFLKVVENFFKIGKKKREVFSKLQIHIMTKFGRCGIFF